MAEIEIATGALAVAEVASYPNWVEIATSGGHCIEVVTPPGFVEVPTIGANVTEVATVEGGTSLTALKPVISTVASDCQSIILTCETGEYPDDTAGWTPEADVSNDSRPKRSEVKLYTVLERYDTEEDRFLLPSIQGPEDWPYTLEIELPVQGLYMVHLVAMPVSGALADFTGESLVDMAKTAAGYLHQSIPLLSDCALMDCVADARDLLIKSYLQGQCEQCPERKYVLMRGLASALATFNMDKATTIYNYLKRLCQEGGCGCGCN